MNLAVDWKLLLNSLSVAAAATALAMVLGFAFALMAAVAARPWRKVLLAVAALVLALPSFVVTNCWIDLLGANGVLNRWLPLNIFSMGGAVWILALMFWPIPAFAIWSAWQRLEPQHFEVDPMLRDRKLLRHLLWPTSRVLALTSAAMVFALALNNFAVPAILQVKVLPARVWVQFNTHLDALAAFAASWLLIVVPLLLLACIRQPHFPWPSPAMVDFGSVMRRQLGRPAFLAAAMVTALTLSFALAPVVQLCASPRTWTAFGPAFTAAQPALVNSLFYAVAASALALIAGLFLARVRFMGWLWILFLVPGVLLGMGAVTLANRSSLDWFVGTGLVVVTLLALRYVALARSLSRVGWLGLDRLLVDRARTEGAGGATILRRVVLPQLAPQLSTAAYLVYLLCLWDVETILLVLPPGGETLAVRIFNLLHYGHHAHVNTLCLLLLGAALAPLLLFALWKALSGRRTSYAVIEPQVAR